MSIASMRSVYHRRIGEEVLRFKEDGLSDYPNLADKGSRTSREIAI
jgi:hypothetical protein